MLDEEIEELLSKSMTPDENEEDPSPDVDDAGNEIPPHDHIIDNGQKETLETHQINEQESENNQSPHTDDDIDNNSAEKEIPQPFNPVVLDRVEIFWPDDNAFNKGLVSQITDSGRHFITHDDDDVENLQMADGICRYESSPNAASENFSKMSSDEQLVLKKIMDTFGNKRLLRHQVQGFEQFPIINAYRLEEDEFKKNVKIVKK